MLADNFNKNFAKIENPFLAHLGKFRCRLALTSAKFFYSHSNKAFEN